jgi:helix-turn-helix protein
MNVLKTPIDGYLSKQAASAYSGLSPRSLDTLVERNELTAFKPVVSGSRTRKTLFRKADLDRWMERHRVGADLDTIVTDVMRDLGKGG